MSRRVTISFSDASLNIGLIWRNYDVPSGYALYTMESSDSDVECGALFGQIRPYQLEPYAARRPEGEEVAAGVDVVWVGNTDW